MLSRAMMETRARADDEERSPPREREAKKPFRKEKERSSVPLSSFSRISLSSLWGHFQNPNGHIFPTTHQKKKRRTYPIRARRGSHGRRERRHRPGGQSGGFLHPALRRVSTTSGGHDVRRFSFFFAAFFRGRCRPKSNRLKPTKIPLVRFSSSLFKRVVYFQSTVDARNFEIETLARERERESNNKRTCVLKRRSDAHFRCVTNFASFLSFATCQTLYQFLNFFYI